MNTKRRERGGEKGGRNERGGKGRGGKGEEDKGRRRRRVQVVDIGEYLREHFRLRAVGERDNVIFIAVCTVVDDTVAVKIEII